MGRISSAMQIGTNSLLTLATGVMLLVYGTTQVEVLQTVNQQTALTGSGAGANTSNFYDYSKYSGYLPLTATGGSLQDTYEVFNWDYPESYTGSVLSFCIDVATAQDNATNMYVDCGVNDGTGSSSGTNLFNNEDLTAGSHCISPAGTEVSIGPDQSIACYSLSATGANLVGDGVVQYRETELN